MVRRARTVQPGYPHHVTQRGVRRQTTFFDDGDFKVYLRLSRELVADAGVRFWAYCLMPNHIHAVLVPERSDSLAKFYRALHQRYARLTNLKYDWQGHMWQARFYSVPLNEVHALTAMRYAELNPVRAGLVKHAADWPWSSTRANLEHESCELIDREATRHLVSDWESYLSAGISDQELRNIRRQTRTGQPDDGHKDGSD